MTIVNVVKFSGLQSKDWLVYKYPSDELVRGSQLIVQEGQVALLITGGAIESIFQPGTHTLKSKNLPILKGIVKIPFGNKTPFTTEILYINTALVMDVAWGTPDPIQLIDPKYHVKLRIRAFGSLGIKVVGFENFYKTLIGAMQESEIVNIQKINDYYRGLVVSRIKTKLAETIIEQKISALEISPKLEVFSRQVQEDMQADFSKYGLEIRHFFIKSINFPDEDFERINKILADAAQFEIMGEGRYTKMRTFDVYETAAGNPSGVSGVFAAAAVGMGTAVGIAKEKNILESGTKTKYCPECGTQIEEGMKFCPGCGKKTSFNRTCKCGTVLSDGAKFCPECGEKIE